MPSIDRLAPVVKAIQAISAEITSIENAIAGFAQSFTTHQLSIADAAGQTCITRSQLSAVLASANQPTSVSASPSPSSSTGDAIDTSPVIQINGDNPAFIQVGASYADLGATITGPQADLNLCINTDARQQHCARHNHGRHRHDRLCRERQPRPDQHVNAHRDRGSRSHTPPPPLTTADTSSTAATSSAGWRSGSGWNL